MGSSGENEKERRRSKVEYEIVDKAGTKLKSELNVKLEAKRTEEENIKREEATIIKRQNESIKRPAEQMSQDSTENGAPKVARIERIPEIVVPVKEEAEIMELSPEELKKQRRKRKEKMRKHETGEVISLDDD